MAALSGWAYTKKDYSFGLDVAGGVRLTVGVDYTGVKPENRAEALNQTLTILERRATAVNAVQEFKIVPKGTDQIIIELPGKVKLDDAIKTIFTSAKIKWYWARNLVTDLQATREFIETREEETENPEVSFQRTLDTTAKKISFYVEGTKTPNPEYQSIIAGWVPILEGDELVKAAPTIGQNGKWIPSFEFSAQGGAKMRAWCTVNQNKREKLAAVLDGHVLSVAALENGAIIDRSGVITGNFSTEYVKNLCALLNSGALPVELKQMGAGQIDPTIGKSALHQIVQVGIISIVVVCAFLLLYYAFPGLVALVALGLYILFSLAVLKLLGATFSLAAIAGFILSVGMAVDANILVFERVKEELRAGKKLSSAIDLGFKRAFPAIMDSNACTIITSAVLWNFGTGPVQGFAYILIIGVALSLFTAIFVTRSLLVFLVGSGIGANPNLYGLNRQWFGEAKEQEANQKPMPVLEKSKLYFMISLATIIPGIIFLALGGLKPNVEFTGGIEASYKITQDMKTADVVEKLKQAGFGEANVQFTSTGNEKQILITVPPSKEVDITQPQVAAKKISDTLGLPADSDRGTNAVGSAIRDETIRNAILGVIVSSALIILYLAMRFGFALGGFVIGLRFATTIIIALLHDVLVCLGLAAIMGYIFGWQISALFISSMLTVIGFSTHDSIVIFDRIRENLRRPLPDEDIKNLINRSITQSLARSVNTSATVIVTLLLLVVMGSATNDLRHFNLAMLVGIVSGTYSSIFNAAPILYFWDRSVARRKGEANTMMGLAKSAASKVRLTRQAAPAGPASETPAAPTQTSYGQVKRRQRANQFGSKPLDDEEP